MIFISSNIIQIMFNIITLEQKVPKKTRFGDYEPIIEHFIKFDIMKIKDSKIGTNFKGGSPQQMQTSSVKFTGNANSVMQLSKKAEAEITKEERKNKTLPVWHKKFNEWRGKFTGNTLQKMYGQWQKNGNRFKMQESNDEYQKRWTDELWAGYEKQLNQINEKFEKIKWNKKSRTCNEKISRKGHNYRGCQTDTRKGYKCQNWSRERPHKRNNQTKYNYKRKRYGVGNHNYCRNADNSKTIWCYTTNPRKRWDYCSPKKPGLSRTETKRRKVLAAAKARAKWAKTKARARAKWARTKAERAQKLKQARADSLTQNKWNKSDADYKAAKAI